MIFTLIYFKSTCSYNFAHLNILCSLQMILSSKFCNRSRCKYLEMKAETQISCRIFIFSCQTQMFLVYCQKKELGLALPIVLDGTVEEKSV